jgi:hypothetical protein
VRKLQCTLVCRTGLGRPAEAAQEISPDSMEIAVGVELFEPVDCPKASLQALRFRQRDSAVQLDNGERVNRASSPYSAAICGQSRVSSACSEAIAARRV